MPSSELTQKQIGRRIMQRRKAKGLSQEELAKSIGISRPSLAQIELGNRSVDALELRKLSLTLAFSLDELLSPEYKATEEVRYANEAPAVAYAVRVSEPELNVAKLKNLLLYLLEHCAGKPNIGEPALNKLLYFCDFNYYELYEEHLTGARYKKLPYGPISQDMEGVINQMINEGRLKRIKTTYHSFPLTRYLPLEKADLTKLSAAEKTVVDHVIQQMGDWNANKISDYSHKDMPWLATDEGDDISYNLAFYRELPYSVRVYEDDN
jgi:transcriptional regulator with XRE-family HTH domain